LPVRIEHSENFNDENEKEAVTDIKGRVVDEVGVDDHEEDSCRALYVGRARNRNLSELSRSVVEVVLWRQKVNSECGRERVHTCTGGP
jgi:hypothetical protein